MVSVSLKVNKLQKNFFYFFIFFLLGAPEWLIQLSVGLDFGSGHDLSFHEFEPHIRLCADSVEPAWDAPSLSAPPRKINKQTLKKFSF